MFEIQFVVNVRSVFGDIRNFYRILKIMKKGHFFVANIGMLFVNKTIVFYNVIDIIRLVQLDVLL